MTMEGGMNRWLTRASAYGMAASLCAGLPTPLLILYSGRVALIVAVASAAVFVVSLLVWRHQRVAGIAEYRRRRAEFVGLDRNV